MSGFRYVSNALISIGIFATSAIYGAAAQTPVSLAATAPAGPVNSITLTNKSGTAITKYSLQFGRPFLDGAIADEPQVLINGLPVSTQADVKNRYPDGSVEFAVVAVLIPTIPASGSLTLTFQNQTAGNNTPLTQTQMISLSYVFSAQMILASTTSSKAESVDARTMLANGDYKLWTSGPVAQTIILADDSPTHKYDIGFGDGHTPFRPRFYATFWPATHQVFVRAVGENGLSTELEDLSYSLTLTGANARVYTNPWLTQPAMSTWTKSFWLGGTPNPEVNIDNNLAYLESTRFVPNYDPSIQISEATIASDYANWWTNTSTDIDGYGAWQPAMGTTGARPDIGPEPSWDVAWLYTGDWRLRQTALGNADLAAQWPVNVRETNPAMRLNRTDPVPAAGQVGSGYGYPISITDRVFLGPSNGGPADFLYYNSGNSNPPNQLDVVGPLSLDCNSSCQDATGWEFDAAHEPSPFFIPYVLTGDPFYLGEMENWAAYDATEQQGDCGDNQCRGPTGDEGGASDQERGDGWTIRSRAETAFAIPDSDPFKTYLTILLNEDLARWEGVMNVTDPVLDGYAEYAWAQQTGNPEGGWVGSASPLGQWAANTDPDVVQGVLAGQGETTSNVGAFNDPWMQWYVQYSLGRAAELGFAAGPLALHTGQFLIGLINNSGYPELVANYEEPSADSSGNWIASWPAYVATYQPAFLTGTGWNYGNGGDPLSCDWNGTGCNNSGVGSEQYPQGYEAYASAALATLADEDAPGAAQAEAWMQPNVYAAIGAQWATDPSWAIIPRTDTNVLPPQPTTPQ
jgi:hypothetical protein